MQLGTDEGQPALQLVTLEAAVGWRELLVRHLVGEILHDRGAFGQQGAVVQLQCRYVALWVDLQEVRAAGRELGLQVNGLELMWKAAFLKDDVG